VTDDQKRKWIQRATAKKLITTMSTKQISFTLRPVINSFPHNKPNAVYVSELIYREMKTKNPPFVAVVVGFSSGKEK